MLAFQGATIACDGDGGEFIGGAAELFGAVIHEAWCIEADSAALGF